MATPLDIKVTVGSWRQLKSAASLVRTAVFIDEQRISEDLEWDEYDEIAHHALLFLKGSPVATARLIPIGNRQGKIGRVAVLKTHRRLGLGAKVLEQLLAKAKELGMVELTLHAQTHATPLYLKFGFQQTGPIFDEAGSDHVLMRLEL